MGWSLRKSFRLLPGLRVNLSKSGPRLSVGIPGVRVSIDMEGAGGMRQTGSRSQTPNREPQPWCA